MKLNCTWINRNLKKKIDWFKEAKTIEISSPFNEINKNKLFGSRSEIHVEIN